MDLNLGVNMVDKFWSIQLSCWDIRNIYYLTNWTNKLKHQSTLLFSFPKTCHFPSWCQSYEKTHLFSVDSWIIFNGLKNLIHVSPLKLTPCKDSCTWWKSFSQQLRICYSRTWWCEFAGKATTALKWEIPQSVASCPSYLTKTRIMQICTQTHAHTHALI